MGAGHLYSYDHFMLIDLSHDYFMEHFDNNVEFSEIIYEDFLYMLRESIKAEGVELFTLKNSYYIFEKDNVFFGIDSSGGCPCIFSLPHDDFKEILEDSLSDQEEKEEAKRELVQYKRITTESFNLFVKMFPGIFRKPTSSWTSEPYKEVYS